MLFSIVLSVLLIFTFLSLSWWLWFKCSSRCQLVNECPGPRPIPLLGNALEMLGGCDVLLRKIHVEWASKYGKIFRLFIGSKIYVVVSSPELVESIVNHPDLLGKGSDYDLLHSWLGFGLLTTSGTKWKSRRRLLTPAFHFHIMEDFFDTFNEHSSILCDKIDKLCTTNGNTEINVDKFTSLCTLDIICETAMGCKINAQTEESEYVRAVSRMAKILILRGISPWSDFDFLYDYTPFGREYHRCLKILLDFTYQVIQTRRKDRQGDELPVVDSDDLGRKRRKPFLDLLLETSQDGIELNDKDISDEVNTFMFEGHDTTAMALNWFLLCMASNPHCQEKVRDELNRLFGYSNRPCTRQDLVELKYLECCIKETLRLYPSVPVFIRCAKADISLGGYRFPEGCNVVLSSYALHRNPKIYSDPLTFDPDRFSIKRSIGRHPYAYIPFSAGPRNCIGQRFAMAEEKVILSTLLRRFKFELAPTAVTPNPSLEMTLKSTTGVHLLVSRV
nr:CYP4AP1 protein [Diaphanosoma celebensis]